MEVVFNKSSWWGYITYEDMYVSLVYSVDTNIRKLSKSDANNKNNRSTQVWEIRKNDVRSCKPQGSMLDVNVGDTKNHVDRTFVVSYLHF